MTINKYRRENGFTPLEKSRRYATEVVPLARRSLTGFTLLELLIVIGILAIVGVIVMLILNPAELFKQSRDTRRMVDLKNIDSAIRLARTESIFMGNSNIVYISVPDPALSGSATSTCPNMGLPPLDPSWKYNCVSQNNLAKNNGTGWIPINFSSLGVGSPFSALPIDPENATSSWRYYRYITDLKGKYIAVSGLYSDKYKPEAAKDGGGDSEKFEVGTNMSLWEESKKYYGLVRENCVGYTNCFTSLYQWEANYSGIPFGICASGDLNCVDKIAVAKIDGAWTSPDTTPVVIDGWTTSINNYIKVYTTTVARHDGKWNNGKYRLINSETGRALYTQVSNIKIDGLQILNQPTWGYDQNAIDVQGSGEVSNNIIKYAGSNGTDINGIYFAAVASVKIYNNMVYDTPKGITTWCGGDVLRCYVYNNTVINSSASGFKPHQWVDTLFINNIVQNSAIGYDVWSIHNGQRISSAHPNSDYNISDIAGDAPNATFSTSSKIVSFISTFTKDFHLSSSDIVAKDAGKNLLSNPNLSFSNDIDGQIRGSIWDIGADEL